ncbi:MAG TPA: SCO family protein, partial [Pseudogracilibacillus sp.]|nr:SCO family protein [Pseudogracilibacillus sp.]
MKNKKRISLIAFILFGLLLSACEKDIDANMSKEMQDFSFITQDNETLNLDDLKGEWWITYFSYTDCRTVCPRTTSNMVDIQSQLKKDGLEPPIISFNVNPEKDGPEELRKYAEENNVDLDTWDFLTGYDFETIQNLSEQSFLAVLEKGAAEQMSHSYMFYLVNPKGEVVKKY